jgi:cell division protein FtsB
LEKEQLNWKRLLITLIIVFATALVTGGSVYYTMDRLAKDEKKSSESESQKLRSQLFEIQKSKNETTNAANGKTVYEITELNLKFTTDEALENLIHDYDSASESASFSTRELSEFGDACGITGQPLGIIVFTNNAPLRTSDPNYSPVRSESAVLKKIGSKYLYYLTPQATCSDDKTAQDLQTSQLKRIKDVLKTAELIK